MFKFSVNKLPDVCPLQAPGVWRALGDLPPACCLDTDTACWRTPGRRSATCEYRTTSTKRRWISVMWSSAGLILMKRCPIFLPCSVFVSCWFARLQDYLKSYEPVFMKVGGQVGHDTGKKSLHFSGDLDQNFGWFFKYQWRDPDQKNLA